MLKNKILLINSNVFFDADWGRSGYAFNPQLLALDSFLKMHKIKANVLDLDLELGRPCTQEEIKLSKRKAVDLISKYDFEIVGISSYAGINYLSTIEIARICKKINPSCIVVVGGSHPTIIPDEFISEEKLFDFIIRGEGEHALLEICKRKSFSKAKFPQVIYGRPLTLDNNYFLDWQGYKYFRKNIPNIGLYLSRGCPFKCSFCIEPLKDKRYFYRNLPVLTSINQIKQVCKILNPRRITILDACFGFNKNWRRNFLKEIIKEKIDKVLWAESRVDLMEKEDIDLLSQLNFRIDFGVESFSKKMLSIMRKTNNPSGYIKHFEAISDYANKKEVLHAIYLIFNHPGETKTTINETFNYLEKRLEKVNGKKVSFLLFPQDYFFTPGSHVYHNIGYYENRFGTVIKHKEWWKEFRPHRKLAQDIIPSFNLKGRIKWGKRFDSMLKKFNYTLSDKAALISFWFNENAQNN